MTFLPIVERELRVASRRQFTYWSRLVAAGFVLLIFGMILTFSRISNGMGWSMGHVQFTVLKWIAFTFAASVGVFLTSDSLSEEKREGTLGLLFLTDLRGHDVVFGKLISQSLQAFYGLLAAFPILALPLLAGGVTGAEFGRAMLVIGNTLFFSLALGLLVSSVSREVMKAMNGVLFLSLLFLVGLPWMDLGLAHWESYKFECVLSAASPGYLFATASNLRPGEYWFYLGLQHALAWGFLILACVIVPRTWQEKTAGATGLRARLLNQWRYGGRRARIAFRRKLLDRDPILWLALRDRWMPRFVWAVTFAVLGFLAWNIHFQWNTTTPLRNANFAYGFLLMGMVLWLTSQACRFFVDAVRNGAMELMLVTPTSPRQIVHGQWSALWRTFLIPVCLLLALKITGEIDSLLAIRKTMASTKAMAGFNMVHYQIAQMISSVVNVLFLLPAMGWFGMWMGTTNRKVSIAVLKTVVFVVILPWLAEIFVQVGSMAFFALRTWPFWLGLVVSGVVELGKNIFFIYLSRRMLLTKFRDIVSLAGQPQLRRRQSFVRPIPAAPEPDPLIT